ERQAGLTDHAEIPDGELLDHERPRSSVAADSDAGPRHPSTGSRNLFTRRSTKGPGVRRASRTGFAERRMMTRAPGGSSKVRRPSHPSPPLPCERSRSATATGESGATTGGRAKRACAASGTTRIASSPGHTTGPPPENAYAVEPVGVEITRPSQPK